jgi:PAS domain S-box-containing protein
MPDEMQGHAMNDLVRHEERSDTTSTSDGDRVARRPFILMVDDQPARLLTYEAILNGLEIQCIRALSGNQALERLLKQEFAVILLDVDMPGMNGFELAQLIRTHPRLERTPIIFITGIHVSELDQLRGYEVGAIDYISVPVVPEILRSKVALLVELYKRRDELQRLNRSLAETKQRLDSEYASRVASHRAELRALFDHPDQSAVIVTAERDRLGTVTDMIYRDANRNAERVLGLTRDQLIGMRLSEVLPERAAEALPLCTQVLDTGEPARYEARVRGADMRVTIYAISPETLAICATDITDRRRMEAALRESEARYRALLEHAPVGVVHASLDGRIQYANAAFCRLLGYKPDELEARTWQELTHPEDLAQDVALAGEVRRHETQHYTMQKRYLRKDGSSVWVELFGSFIFDESGVPTQGLAVVLDITERQRAEAALRESQENLLLTKRAAGLGTYDWDIRTDTLVWDERTHEIWGIEPAGPMKVAAFFSQVHPDDHASTQRAIDKSFDPEGDHVYAALYRVINRVDGITRWIEASGHVYFDQGQPARMIGVVQEVTERVVAQEQLAESEQRFRELANNIDQFAWTCDELGKGTWYNDRWYEYTGTTLEDMCGDGWRRVHDPAHLPRVIAHLQRCLETGTPWEDTFPLRGKDGSYRWFLSRAAPIRDAAGKVVRWFGTNTDVTELRNLQQALEEADHRKDEFLAMLAHELRNPVAPISNAAEILSRILAGDDRTKPLTAMIHRQVAHLSRLLDDLLDVARITQRRIELRKEVVSVSSCLEVAIETAQPLIREKAHKLAVIQNFQPLHVSADKVRLAQCLANVLINSAKYTKPGGEIRVRPYAENGCAVIEIADNGIGIAPDFLPRMFDLFAQSERSADRSQGGLGIGLAVCKQLIEMHGGRVHASSAGVDQGTTVVFRLPLVQSPASHAETAPEKGATRRKILVVDDNCDAADSMLLLLQLEGHDVRAAYSARSALELADTFEPDVVLLDIGLPGMDGYEVASKLKLKHRPLRLIALSGYGQVEDRQRSASAGFDRHLVKPVDSATLRQALEL